MIQREDRAVGLRARGLDSNEGLPRVLVKLVIEVYHVARRPPARSEGFREQRGPTGFLDSDRISSPPARLHPLAAVAALQR